MKFKRILIYISALVLLLSVALCITSCSESIDKPTGLYLEMDTQTLRWQRVSAAASYEVKIDGDERIRTTTATYISLEFLDAGYHTVSVRAKSGDENFEPSEWSSYSFERKPESGLRYKLINNRTEYQLVGIGTAEGDVVMESEYRGLPVTSIADTAFNKSQKLTSIVIAKTVRDIGKNAFSNCSELVSVSFEEGSELKTVGEYAFQSCKKLQTITLPDGLSEIPDYMFSWCSALESAILPESVSVIGAYAFSNCETLHGVNFPEKLSVIEEYAFSDCSSIEVISLPDELLTISLLTFSNCTSLKELTFGDKLSSIGDGAFMGCSSISKIELPDSLKTIGVQSFFGCSALSEVTIGEGLTSIGAQAFLNTKITDEAPMDELIVIGGWVIGAKNPSITRIRIKDGVRGVADYAFTNFALLESVELDGVSYIGNYAFAGCTLLMEAVFDDALLTVGDYSFASCIKLAFIDFGKSLTSIGNYSFRGCSMLQNNIELPKTLTSIGTYAFHDTYAFQEAEGVVYIDDWVVGIKDGTYTDVVINDNTRGIASYSFYQSNVLYSIVMPDSLEYIGRAAFYSCSTTMLITLPKNLKVIGDYAFYGCTIAAFGLDRVTVIPEGTVSIGRSAFYRCAGMVGLTIPESVKFIGDYAFYQCVNLGNSQIPSSDDMNVFLKGEVVFEEGVEYIGNKAFQECVGIETLILPKSLKGMGERAFYKCTSLEYIDMNCELKYIPAYAFFGCTSLEKIDFSESVKEIGTYAFRGCTALPKIIIGEGIEKIGNYAFFGCTGVQEIIIPSGVCEIGSFAFRGCTAVGSVLIPESVEILGAHAFYGLNKASLYCEADGVLPYWNERWNSSYRPVFWGCEFSTEGRFVVSFVKSEENPENIEAIGGISAPYREGYSFLGWSESAEGESLISSEEIDSSYNGKTLYPIFVKSDYIIEFNSNKPLNSTYAPMGVMLKTGCLFGVEYNLPMSEYSLIGWVFKGWATSPMGEVVYSDGELITEPIASEGGSTVTLYAVWEPKPYTIIYDANKPQGASGELMGSMPVQETTLDSVITLYPNQYAIEGWKFLGWSGIPVGEPQIPDEFQTSIKATPEEIREVTLYAIWAPIEYSIVFETNLPEEISDGIINNMAELRCKYDSVSVLPVCSYYLEDYTFLGWSTSPDGSLEYSNEAEILNLTVEDGKRVVFYAVWQKN